VKVEIFEKDGRIYFCQKQYKLANDAKKLKSRLFKWILIANTQKELNKLEHALKEG